MIRVLIFLLHYQHQAGDGLLSLAAWHDRPNIVRMLLYDFKANVHAKNFTKTTALHRASACGSLNCAAILLEKGADAEVCDSAGRTPVDTCSTVAIREFLKVCIIYFTGFKSVFG